MADDLRPHLPLKPVDLQLLLALGEGERHGYGLVQAIAAGTDGLVQLDPGNLYRVIKRLLADGLLAESPARAVPELGSERRRYYRLTPLGGRELGAALRRLEALVEAPAQQRLHRARPHLGPLAQRQLGAAAQHAQRRRRRVGPVADQHVRRRQLVERRRRQPRAERGRVGGAVGAHDARHRLWRPDVPRARRRQRAHRRQVAARQVGAVRRQREPHRLDVRREEARVERDGARVRVVLRLARAPRRRAEAHQRLGVRHAQFGVVGEAPQRAALPLQVRGGPRPRRHAGRHRRDAQRVDRHHRAVARRQPSRIVAMSFCEPRS
ncbi:PadR family transcriptional regulator [Roseisolibacter sp. H3M3-2]|uniref:PadR family transcriptional regulator n=1 Tax=Roseisolibacter sp. H3M3-2 TaxID=3031323 RepID=UPI0023DC3CB9|nr:PadR family transcriptional regulator [Roseisolibacter sp. H3M3-2]MDF1504232.1 PadR family transcriptional regulator [Roseisolibacter sp. H3M3-2]